MPWPDHLHLLVCLLHSSGAWGQGHSHVSMGTQCLGYRRAWRGSDDETSQWEWVKAPFTLKSAIIWSTDCKRLKLQGTKETFNLCPPFINEDSGAQRGEHVCTSATARQGQSESQNLPTLIHNAGLFLPHHVASQYICTTLKFEFRNFEKWSSNRKSPMLLIWMWIDTSIWGRNLAIF